MTLLAQFLVALGAAAGRIVHYDDAAIHPHLNECVILVGPSGKGRKAPHGTTSTRCSRASGSASPFTACPRDYRRAKD